MRVHQLVREQRIPEPLSRVFAFFADAANLERITPPELRFRIDTPLPVPMGVGTLIDYRLVLFGVPFRWRTRISQWEPGVGFVDEQLEGPYRLWVHRHDFAERDGATQMVDRLDYALPLPPLGEAALPLVRRQLDRIFDFRAAAVGSIFS